MKCKKKKIARHKNEFSANNFVQFLWKFFGVLLRVDASMHCCWNYIFFLLFFFSLNSAVSAWYLQFEMSEKKRKEIDHRVFSSHFVLYFIRFHGYIVSQHQIAEILSFDWKEKHISIYCFCCCCCWNFRLKGLFSHLFGACNAQQLYDDRYHVNKFSLEAIILYSLHCLFSNFIVHKTHPNQFSF